MIAILKNGSEIRRVADESAEYDALVETGCMIDDIVEDDDEDFDDGVRWADGSRITAADREHRAGAVRVRYDLHAMKDACDEMGLRSYELDSFGSRYLNVEVARRTIKVRVSDHERLSALHEAPELNVTPTTMTADEAIAAIKGMM